MSIIEKPKDVLEKHSRWEGFVAHYRITYILVLGVLLVGLFSALQMPKESAPEVDFPVAVVSTIFPGASAEEVEEFITNPLEDKIRSLSNLQSLTSVSRQGFSLITVEFDVDADTLEAMTDLRTKVDAAKPELPSDAEDPAVQQISFSDVPIITFSLSGPYDPAQLKEYAEDLRREIEVIAGVSQVSITGAPERQVRVLIDAPALDRFGISLAQVLGALRQANTDVPIGQIETNNEVYTVRFAGQLDRATDVMAVPIGVVNGVPVTISDIGTVIDGAVETGTIARLSIDGQDPTPSVTVRVFKISGGNILQLVENVQEKIAFAQSAILPEGVVVEIISNDAQIIQEDLGNLLKNGFQTIVIILILLIVFLGWREALLASLSVPLTMLMTLIFLNQFGYTINFLTLFSLILALGILVDSSIVIVEGIHGYLLQGKTSREAAVLAIREFKLPLAAGTFTTIFVFLPMLMTSGIIGKFIVSIPVTVTIVLLSSIVVAMGVIPSLGARFLRQRDAATATSGLAMAQRWISKLYGAYDKTLMSLLVSRVKQRVLLITISVLFVLSIMLPGVGVVTINMFPAPDLDSFVVDLENPIGTSLQKTDADMRILEQVLQQDPRVTSFAVSVGSASNIGSVAAASTNTHLGSITVNIAEEREQSSLEIVEEYQALLEPLVAGTVRVSQEGGGPEQGPPVSIEVHGDSLEVLDTVAFELADVLREIPGTRNVEVSSKEVANEFVITIDRARAQQFGLNASDVALLLRSAISGTAATVLKYDGDDIDVVLKYNLNPDSTGLEYIDTISPEALRAITIATPIGDIPLGAITETTVGASRALVSHDDGQRIVRVTAFNQREVQAQQIIAAFDQRLASVQLPEGYSVQYGGENESINKSFSDMFRAMILGILAIAALLVWQFRSYRQTVFILVTIPLALIGVLPGLMIVNQPLSFPAFIGVVALAGIVVNNAIILIDRINENRRHGMAIDEAVHESATSRLQPIILTTATTVAGILPLALSSPDWGPLGYSIVFGLLFSTVLTLFIVPILYSRYAEKTLEE